LTADPAESAPTVPRHTGPAADTEAALAEVLADLVGVERVSVDSHFFDDLGADSLVMARFCARVRKRPDLPSVSMRDIYRYSTIRSLATAFTEIAPAPVEPPAAASTEATKPAEPTGTPRYVLCGALQLVFFLGYALLAALVAARSYEWVSAGSGLVDVYLRSALAGVAGFVGLCALPIVAKWTLIGRWTHQRFRIWSLAYVRFWVVKTLVRANPLVLFVGSPLYVLYLRALGAKVGRDVLILSRHVPVCTDLLTLGDGTVVRKDSFFAGYRANAGQIQTGAVTLGRNAFVGEQTVLDIDTSLGDEAQLGRASALHTGQSVPEGERWHGSPAERTEVDYRTVSPIGCGALRKVGYSAAQLLSVLALVLPLVIGGGVMLVAEFPRLAGLLDPESVAFTSWRFFGGVLTASVVLFFGLALAGLIFVATVPRLLNLAIKPGKVYRLYGLHYAAYRVIARTTNVRFFKTLFGDSSAIVHYLRYLGYRLSHVVQTGSNFGEEVKHDIPYLSSVGSGTMVADGLSVINAEFSNSSFRVSPVSIGPRNFLGNHIAYPAQGRTGDNCLLATKVMVPIDGEVREDVGLLGSPSFEIPRSVERDGRFDGLASGEGLRRRLAAKNRHNAVTMGLHLLERWIYFFGVTLLAAAAVHLLGSFGAAAIALQMVVGVLFSVGYIVLVERVATRFRALRPLYCSIYDPSFWRHERYWKVAAATEYIRVLNGTPFKNLVWRLMGVRIGRRVFDDGCFLPERTLTTIGDDSTLNEGTVIQCHSQEDGAFKSDHITVGAGCTVGVGALVHYGVTMGDGARLAPDSFLMKGEDVPAHAQWGGNPAREIRDGHHAATK
jgi:non-ribosomal peptide synthetase-like protein